VFGVVCLGCVCNGVLDENGDFCDEEDFDEYVFVMLVNRCLFC